MVAIMERARAEHPSLRKVIILNQLPRADSEHLSDLARTYNTTLRELVAAAPSNNHCEMLVASHDSLTPTSQAMKFALFGSPTVRGTDGIHFRGRGSNKRHTNSVISALKTVGLGGWTVQSGLGAGRPQRDQTPNQTVRTSNQYSLLNC